MPVALHLGRPVPLTQRPNPFAKTQPFSDSGGATAPHPFGEWNQSVVFSDALVQDMRESAELTREDGRERGFYFCQDPNTNVVGKNSLNRTYSDNEPVPLPTLPLGMPWAVLKAAPRCKGETCAVDINQRCEAVTDWVESRKLLKRAKRYAGVVGRQKGFGHHHTHPDRFASSPSPGDLMNIIHSALYDGQPAMGCITGVRPKEKSIRDWGPNGDRFGCYAIPPSLLPSADKYAEMLSLYHAHISPYYREWARSESVNPPGAAGYAGDYTAYRNAYDKIEAETYAMMARIEFPNIDKMAEGTVHAGGLTGGSRDKTTKDTWGIFNWVGGEHVPGWVQDKAAEANISPDVDLRYINTYKVRTRTTPDAEIKQAEQEVLAAQAEHDAKERQERREQDVRDAEMAEERLQKRERDRQAEEIQMREHLEQERLERDKQTLERIRARRERAIEGGQRTGFIEEFGSLENCLKGVFPGGGRMSTQQLKRIASVNGIDTSKPKSEICEELAAMETVIHA